jgi:hypothetical protein
VRRRAWPAGERGERADGEGVDVGAWLGAGQGVSFVDELVAEAHVINLKGHKEVYCLAAAMENI